MIGFRYSDSFLPNNYGQLRITLTPMDEIPTLDTWLLGLLTAVLLVLGMHRLRDAR